MTNKFADLRSRMSPQAQARAADRAQAMLAGMFSPPHPGEVLREYLGDVSVTRAAQALHVTRASLSRILNGSAGISADMALRLADALGTSAELWAGMQLQHDLNLAQHKPRPTIERLADVRQCRG